MAPIPKEEYGPKMGEELKTGGFWRDLFSEFVATFLFITMTGLLRGQAGSNLEFGIGVAFVWTAVGYGLGDFGGAHMNSSVTMAMMIRAEITFVKALFYWILQTVAALAAYFAVDAFSGTMPVGFVFTSTALAGRAMWQDLLVEAVVTLVVCLAALATGNIPRKGYIILQSVPVGLAAGMGTLVAMPYTGACMSSTQALGHQIMMTIKDSNSVVWDDHWHYWAGPMIGAVLAAILYWIFDVVDRPSLQNTYSTWTYADAKNKSISKQPLTQNRFEDEDYPGRRSPPHHSHHGYNPAF